MVQILLLLSISDNIMTSRKIELGIEQLLGSLAQNQPAVTPHSTASSSVKCSSTQRVLEDQRKDT